MCFIFVTTITEKEQVLFFTPQVQKLFFNSLKVRSDCTLRGVPGKTNFIDPRRVVWPVQQLRIEVQVAEQRQRQISTFWELCGLFESDEKIDTIFVLYREQFRMSEFSLAQHRLETRGNLVLSKVKQYTFQRLQNWLFKKHNSLCLQPMSKQKPKVFCRR